jgi:excisionase family DNA binding protein
VNGALLTARELAELLGVSAETVLRWTRRGEMPALRLPGGTVRYRPDAVEAWLEARATTADATDRELSDTRASRARRGGAYPGALPFGLSDTRPPLEAVTTGEDDYAR